jgi:hypothetical protein
MRKHIARLLMLVLTSASMGLWAQQTQQQSKSQRFAFRSGQSLYIAAFHYEGGHGRYGSARSEIRDDLAAEQLVRKEFEKLRVFKPVDKASEADYVFVVYIHDQTAEGIAVSPEKYAQSKPDLFKGDLDPLREAAFARYLVGPFKLPILSRMSAELVRKFHEEALKNK